jgi:hypothetical protein
MGLTIHYSLSVPKDWSAGDIRAKLESLRQFCLDLPVREVSELREFRGDECEPGEDDDPCRWAKIQAARTIESPWQPDTFFQQQPSHMLIFSVWPAPGCEQMNLGVCSYPPLVCREPPEPPGRTGAEEKHVVPGEKGTWSSFCKTQFANDPRLGGTPNFLRAHLAVCAILEKAGELGFLVEVSDEGDFWTKRDVRALAETIGKWDRMLAGVFGAMKDAMPEGTALDSAMSGRPDFEQLEAKAQSTEIGKLLEQIKAFLPMRENGVEAEDSPE